MSELIRNLREAGYEATIGLEVHAQLNTESKIFACDPNLSESDSNTNIGVVSLGHPGTLPVLNKRVLEKAISMGLACDCSITQENHFARKSYFYPDLPKGYQTTQDKTPVCIGGRVNLVGENLLQDHVSLHHIHMEEDAGKSVHDDGHDTLIDLNRAGSPLIEIVTNPCILGPHEAAIFLQETRRIVRFLGISQGNMEKGELRCDANISIKPIGRNALGRKVEIKNMNSFNHVKKAVTFEIKRQLELVRKGEIVEEETRTFDPNTSKTSAMRFKETMNDYRYFPCPDLPPVVITNDDLERMSLEAKRIPEFYRKKFSAEYSLSDYDTQLLVEEPEIAEYFEALCKEGLNPQKAAKFINGPYKGYLNATGKSLMHIGIKQMAEILKLLEEGKLLVNTVVHKLLPHITDAEQSVLKLAQVHKLMVNNNYEVLHKLTEEVLLSLPVEVEAFRKGKKKLMGLFMGEVMKKSGGQANPKEIQRLLNEKLK